tara:strand:+ start:377 stop:556 length:180 start_codon:yes stop_codon:yes gene_type:complete
LIATQRQPNYFYQNILCLGVAPFPCMGWFLAQGQTKSTFSVGERNKTKDRGFLPFSAKY